MLAKVYQFMSAIWLDKSRSPCLSNHYLVWMWVNPGTRPPLIFSIVIFSIRFLFQPGHVAKLCTLSFVSMPKTLRKTSDAAHRISLWAWHFPSGAGVGPRRNSTSDCSSEFTIFSQSWMNEEVGMVIHGAFSLAGSSGGGGMDGPVSAVEDGPLERLQGIG